MKKRPTIFSEIKLNLRNKTNQINFFIFEIKQMEMAWSKMMGPSEIIVLIKVFSIITVTCLQSGNQSFSSYN